MREDMFGYTGNILWLNLTAQSYELEHRDELFWRNYAGGGLAATELLLGKTKPGVDPLGPENLLIFASSVVAGHPACGLARFTTAAKSPLTNGIGETRTEGPWGIALKGSGADILVFTGRAKRQTSVVIENGKVEFHDASEIWGMQTGEATDRLEQQFGSCIHTAVIGPAGENLVRFASIITNRCYQASRMGMGAVMGSKQLKAVVLRNGKRPPVHCQEELDAITNSFSRRIPGNSLSLWQQQPPGFSCWLYLHGLDAALCVNNYRASAIAGLENFKEENFLKHNIRELGCPGCPNNCIKSIHPKGNTTLDERASGIHQEATGTLGPNIGVSSLEDILSFSNLSNQYGMDPTSLGFTLSFAMELFDEGILTREDHGEELRFGDSHAVCAMIKRIAARTGLGDLLAEGSKRAAQVIGNAAEQYAMQVKGLELVPFEPRSQTNLALGYAVAPVGPRYDICEHDWDFDTEVGWDHSLDLCRTLGIRERIPMGYLGPEKVRNFKALLCLWSAADALDMCIFATAPTRLLSMPQMAAILRAVTGWESSDYEIMRFGERRLHLMRLYNLREGLGCDDDRLPDRFFDTAIATGPREGDYLDREKFQDSIQTFYAMMGWDDHGVPLEATLCDAGIALKR